MNRSCGFLQALLGTLAVAGMLAADTGPARAQGGLEPVSMVVAYAPGGPNDIIARALAHAMSGTLGQPVVVENRSGAGGVVGTNYVAKAAPDGRTIGWGTSSQLVMNGAIHKSLPFDVEKDLAQVGLAVRFPIVVVGRNDIKSLKQFVENARANPGKFSYGSGGKGSVSHVMTELFVKEAGIEVVHVPYRGVAPGLLDMAAGRIEIFMDTVTATRAAVQSGQVRWLGIGGQQRSSYVPEVPTFKEQGFDFDPYSWNSVFVPAKTPREVLARLNAGLNAALKSDQFAQRLKQFAAELLGPSTPAEAEKFVARERAKWVPFIRDSGIAAE